MGGAGKRSGFTGAAHPVAWGRVVGMPWRTRAVALSASRVRRVRRGSVARFRCCAAGGIDVRRGVAQRLVGGAQVVGSGCAPDGGGSVSQAGGVGRCFTVRYWGVPSVASFLAWPSAAASGWADGGDRWPLASRSLGSLEPGAASGSVVRPAGPGCGWRPGPRGQPVRRRACWRTASRRTVDLGPVFECAGWRLLPLLRIWV